MKKILMVGGAGYVGSRLIDDLISRNLISGIYDITVVEVMNHFRLFSNRERYDILTNIT